MKLSAVLLMFALSLALAVLLTACNPPFATVCASASAAIKTITIADKAGKISPADEAKVTQAITVVAPICEAPTEPTLSDAERSAFEQAMFLLTKMQTKYIAPQ